MSFELTYFQMKDGRLHYTRLFDMDMCLLSASCITRMLRYFQDEGLVKLSRGKITILDPKRLETLQRS